MGAYYRDVVVVIELGAYIHGVLTFNGCLLSRFYGMGIHENAADVGTKQVVLICYNQGF